MRRSRLVVGLLVVLGGGAALGAVPAEPAAPYDEQYRPQYHFSPQLAWMNDPNGMVYDGGYQLFYQYNPYATQWGPMHWGHAVSRDLVHWDNKPIALFPDEHGTIFSGSAVVDTDNTSGLGSKDRPPLVAMFTYNNEWPTTVPRTLFQSQGLAFSLDQGQTWTKYAGNPVLTNPGMHDFRDPKVSWNRARRLWIVTLAVHDHVAFYSSPDLIHWTHESDFGLGFGAGGGVWECPDLIELTAGVGSKAVLLVSVNPGGPNGGSGTQYFVGEFDGHSFTPDTAYAAGTAARWLDHGTDDYAGSTWVGSKPGDSRQLFIGWMSNWEYAGVVPTQRWRSAMTLPRELRLVDTAGGWVLTSSPVAELAALRTTQTVLGTRSVRNSIELKPRGTSAPGARTTGLLEIEASIETQRAARIEWVFSNSSGNKTVFRINKTAHRYEVDRSASGAVDFNPSFPALQTAPLVGDAATVGVHVFLDRSSIEIFIDGGRTVFTTIVFPSTPYDTVVLTGDAPMRLKSATVYGLAPSVTGHADVGD